MKNIKLIVVAALLVAGLMSCTHSQYSNLAYVTEGALKGEVVGSFTTDVKVAKLLSYGGGISIVNMSADKMDQPVQDAILAEVEALGGKAAVNVQIVYRQDVVGILIQQFTGNIYSPGIYTITGDVIK